MTDNRRLELEVEVPRHSRAGLGGTAFVLVYRYQDRTYPAIRAYLFGAGAPAVAAREQPRWQAWMDERFASRTPA